MVMPDLINITNGKSPLPTFSGNEMNNRLSKLRQTLINSGVDAALFTSYHNINYYSDFLYCQFARPYGLVVDDSNQTTITANIDGGQPGRRTYGGNLIYTDWKQDNWFRAVKKLGAGGYREHDILVVTEDGNRNITGFPYGPEHNIIN